MDNPYAFDGQDSNWRTEIDLATALGSLSTGAPSTEEPGPASPPGASTSSPVAAPASPPSPRPQRPPPSAPPPSEIAPRKPPQQPGVVAGMIDSIFRNVMLSAEANDLADGLDGLHVGGGRQAAHQGANGGGGHVPPDIGVLFGPLLSGGAGRPRTRLMIHHRTGLRMHRQHAAAAGADVDAEDEWIPGHGSIIEECEPPVEWLRSR